MYKLKSLTLTVLMLVFFAITSNVNAAGGKKNTRVSNTALSVSETDSLLFMREEEKLARDVYLNMYGLWGDDIFKNIASSEQQHMDALKVLLDKYNLPDPIIDSIGSFNNPELQTLHDGLITRGEKSHLEALYVGAYIEEVDMHDILVAINEATHQDIINTYENLLKGSRNHLRSFVSKIESLGNVYSAQYLTQEEVDAIVNTPMERGSN